MSCHKCISGYPYEQLTRSMIHIRDEFVPYHCNIETLLNQILDTCSYILGQMWCIIEFLGPIDCIVSMTYNIGFINMPRCGIYCNHIIWFKLKSSHNEMTLATNFNKFRMKTFILCLFWRFHSNGMCGLRTICTPITIYEKFTTN